MTYEEAIRDALQEIEYLLADLKKEHDGATVGSTAYAYAWAADQIKRKVAFPLRTALEQTGEEFIPDFLK